MADNKVRSSSKEKALDVRIAEINLKNKADEERQTMVRNEAKTIKPIKVNDGNIKQDQPDMKPQNSKASENKKQQNDKRSRDWDSGKTPAVEWKTNVPEINDRRQSKPIASNRRPNPRRPHVNKPMAGFQHDDRFTEGKPNGDEKEKSPDENQKPKDGQGNQRRAGPSNKRPIFGRVTRNAQLGDSALPQRPRVGQANQLGNRPRRQNPLRNGQQAENTQNGDQPANERPRNRHRFNNRQNKPREGDESQLKEGGNEQLPKQQRQRQPRPNKQNQVEGEQQNVQAKRRTPKIRPNRPVPDKVQVRQVVRQLIGRVVMQERREQLGMPKVEKETEL